MMKATKEGLKRFFQANKETTFTFKTITKYYDTNNNLIVQFDDESEPQKRIVKSVTPTYIRFDGSNLEISSRLQVNYLTENYVVVSYPGYEVELNNVEYDGTIYDKAIKHVEKIITYLK